MRTNTRIAVLLLALTLAGCAADDGGGDGVATAGKAGAEATPSASALPAKDRPLKYAQCMREQGLDWFPDPEAETGRTKVMIPETVPKETFDAAQSACRQWAPDGGDDHRLNPAELEQARRMAQCMRDNGVPNFPDPDGDGRIKIDGRKTGVGPGHPDFEAAERLCDSFRPSGAPGRVRE